VRTGIVVNDETLAMDLMIEKGPGKDFMTEAHTLRHMRSEFFAPQLANRKKRELAGPDDDALSRARAFVAGIRSGEAESRLPSEVRHQVLQRFPEIRRAGPDGAPLAARRLEADRAAG
jgi:trimethylamine--corrinoid protein Co-methyltransferase